MGSCMGRCFLQKNSNNCYHSQHDSFNDNEFNFLVDETDNSTTEQKRSSFISRILSKKNSRNKKHKKPVLELVEDLFHVTPGSSYSRLSKSSNKRFTSTSTTGKSDIPLQCLDVRALLARNVDPTTSSTPVSSLDLEWEHETLPISVHDPSISSWAILPEENLPDLTASDTSITRQAGLNSVSDWSRVSSADSLEWDPVQSPLRCTPPGSVDTDTQQLLHEIELLTDQALRETGSALNS